MIYDRSRLKNGNVIRGPAVVEQPDSTTLILENQMARVDDVNNLIIAIA